MNSNIKYASVTVRMPEELLTRLDDEADTWFRTRSEMLRCILAERYCGRGN